MAPKDRGTISLTVLDTSDGVARFGGTVTFDVATDATAHPWVTLRCYQQEVLVYQLSLRMDLGGVETRTFTLGPTPAWMGGAAEAVADLEDWDNFYHNRKTVTLASLTFPVSA